ncbi:MAG: response regulator [Planctomycetota bacterium]
MPDPACTVLVVDDDPGLIAAIRTRLEARGIACVTASTGAQGIAAFRSSDVDLVITDLSMPMGDGVALADAVRAESSVPIFVLTGRTHDYRRTLRGIRDATVLQKPIAGEALVALVLHALGRPNGSSAFGSSRELASVLEGESP